MDAVARQIYWNIGTPSKVLMYLGLVVALAVAGYGLWKRVRYWNEARPEGERLGSWGKRLGILVNDVLLQRGVAKKAFPGFFHGFIFYSFIVLVLATAAVFVSADFTEPVFGYRFFEGWIYRVLSIGADVGGVFVLIGIGMAAWRRYVTRAPNLERKPQDAVALGLVAVIVLTGYGVEALRIHHTGETEWWWSPVGTLLALGAGTGNARAFSPSHFVLWWVHTAAALSFIAIIPFTKFFHILSLPTSAFLQDLSGNPALKRVDLEELMSSEDFDEANFTLGVASPKQYSWGNRLDHDACIECGRCQDACPAARAGDPFGPKTFVMRLRDHGHAMLEAQEAHRQSGSQEPFEETPLVDSVFDEHFVWYCRTCRACMEVCPAHISHVPQFMEIRRNEVSINGRMPEEAQPPLRTLQNNMNAFGNPEERVAWMDAAGVRVVEAGEKVEALYFVGCLTSFDVTKRKIAEDLFRVFRAAGVDFGVLGADEMCCGDPARVLGDEMVFQTVAKAQLETLQARTFDYIVVSCPHCYHTLANEYRSFGAELKVRHHSEVVAELVASGRLKLANGLGETVAFHDPCYLGRNQGVFQPPRDVLKALPGLTLKELAESRQDSLCCGAGGGHFWMDFKAPERINNIRLRQAQDAGCDTVATGCPFCMQMLVDSVALLDLDDKVKIQDIATLVARALPAGAGETEGSASA